MNRTWSSRHRLALAWGLAGVALAALLVSLLELDRALLGPLSWLWLVILAVAVGWFYLVTEPRGDG